MSGIDISASEIGKSGNVNNHVLEVKSTGVQIKRAGENNFELGGFHGMTSEIIIFPGDFECMSGYDNQKGIWYPVTLNWNNNQVSLRTQSKEQVVTATKITPRGMQIPQTSCVKIYTKCPISQGKPNWATADFELYHGSVDGEEEVKTLLNIELSNDTQWKKGNNYWYWQKDGVNVASSISTGKHFLTVRLTFEQEVAYDGPTGISIGTVCV